jgi:hypothetical protein
MASMATGLWSVVIVVVDEVVVGVDGGNDNDDCEVVIISKAFNTGKEKGVSSSILSMVESDSESDNSMMDFMVAT